MGELIATGFVDGTKPKPLEKIKASGLQIIVTGKVDKPYYELLYYDISDKKWHIGYSSYELAYVVEWKNTCFEVVDIEFEEVKRGEWIDKWEGKYANPTYVCSNCGEKALLECYINELSQWRYRQSLSIRCPHCGAKMDGGNLSELPTGCEGRDER